MMDAMLHAELLAACDRFELPDGKRKVEPKPSMTVLDDGYYFWRYTPPSPYRTVMAVLILSGVLAIVMFPLWPHPLRVAASYALTGLAVVLIAFLAFVLIVPPVFFVLTKYTIPPGIWILPNINEDVGFFESFLPLWDWHKPKASKSKTAAKGSDPSPAAVAAPAAAVAESASTSTDE